MKVLIAEDEGVSRARLTRRLSGWGYEVVVARDGIEAWEALQRDDAPSLAIIDWMMPGIDGAELCRRIRRQAREPYQYVLLLTGKDRKEDLIAGLEAGADDYLTKPFDAHELEVRVRGGRRIVELSSELVASRQAMWFQATHDPLTGAWNRASVLDALTRELVRERRGGGSCGVLLIDLDHFKRINDRHGHLVGDEVLRASVLRMVTSIRPYDLVGRYGGEEFLVLLPCCSAPEASAVAQRICDALAREPVLTRGLRIEATCSIGVSASLGDRDADAIIGRADAALYRAKNAGRNRVETTTMNSERTDDERAADGALAANSGGQD
jgi:diguanylate cyclase (GGDEF)-like protein